MAKVVVYRFTYFNRESGKVEEAPDFATRKAIGQMGATALEHTARSVEEGRVAHSGILIAPPDPEG